MHPYTRERNSVAFPDRWGYSKGMTTNKANTPEAIKARLLEAMDKATGTVPKKGLAPWPGLPFGQVPMWDRETVTQMVSDGLVEKIRIPSYTNPNRLATFYRRAR